MHAIIKIAVVLVLSLFAIVGLVSFSKADVAKPETFKCYAQKICFIGFTKQECRVSKTIDDKTSFTELIFQEKIGVWFAGHPFNIKKMFDGRDPDSNYFEAEGNLPSKKFTNDSFEMEEHGFLRKEYKNLLHQSVYHTGSISTLFKCE